MTRYPSNVEFKKMLLAWDVQTVYKEWFTSGIPYVFRDSSPQYASFRAALASSLEVSDGDISIIGSAWLGFSLSPRPNEYGAAFSEESDIDVVVAAREYFDRVWFDLLRWHHSSPQWMMPAHERDRILKQCPPHHVYWGHICPDTMTGISTDSKRWASAFRSLARIPHLASWKINARLYRLPEHAQMYQENSLRLLAEAFRGPRGFPRR